MTLHKSASVGCVATPTTQSTTLKSQRQSGEDEFRPPQVSSAQFVGLYDFKRTLGTGSFGTVKLAEHALTKEKVAIKIINKSILTPMAQERLYNEVRIMRLLQHPNIISLYEVAETPTQLFLITEYADGGDLFERICKKGKIPEERARQFFRHILSAISFCHELHIAHRDLKPENILFLGKDVLKVSDFGMSNEFKPGAMMETVCGSLAYSAPEILIGEAYNGPAIDVWSMGIMLYYMVVGRLPFDSENSYEMVINIREGKYDMDSSLSPELQSLIRQMLVVDQSKRITVGKIWKTQWMKNGKNRDSKELDPLSLGQELTPEEDAYIKSQMVSLGLDIEELKTDLQSNAKSHVVATYHLLRLQQLRKRKNAAEKTPATRTGSGLSNHDRRGGGSADNLCDRHDKDNQPPLEGIRRAHSAEAIRLVDLQCASWTPPENESSSQGSFKPRDIKEPPQSAAKPKPRPMTSGNLGASATQIPTIAMVQPVTTRVKRASSAGTGLGVPSPLASLAGVINGKLPSFDDLRETVTSPKHPQSTNKSFVIAEEEEENDEKDGVKSVIESKSQTSVISVQSRSQTSLISSQPSPATSPWVYRALTRSVRDYKTNSNSSALTIDSFGQTTLSLESARIETVLQEEEEPEPWWTTCCPCLGSRDKKADQPTIVVKNPPIGNQKYKV